MKRKKLIISDDLREALKPVDYFPTSLEVVTMSRDKSLDFAVIHHKGKKFKTWVKAKKHLNFALVHHKDKEFKTWIKVKKYHNFEIFTIPSITLNEINFYYENRLKQKIGGIQVDFSLNKYLQIDLGYNVVDNFGSKKLAFIHLKTLNNFLKRKKYFLDAKEIKFVNYLGEAYIYDGDSKAVKRLVLYHMIASKSKETSVTIYSRDRISGTLEGGFSCYSVENSLFSKGGILIKRIAYLHNIHEEILNKVVEICEARRAKKYKIDIVMRDKFGKEITYNNPTIKKISKDIIKIEKNEAKNFIDENEEILINSGKLFYEKLDNLY